MTYKQAYDKIIDAYFKDEIKPFSATFCFCGTLCGNRSDWHNHSDLRLSDTYHNDYIGYTGNEFARMEHALILPVMDIFKNSIHYEDKLFSGMCAALDVLKEIHRARGENVDEVPGLIKRSPY